MVTSPAHLERLSGAVELKSLKIVLTGIPNIEATATAGVYSWIQMSTGRVGSNLIRCIDVDPVAILYTSGSTGLSKGVVLSHQNLMTGAESVNSYLHTGRDDVILALLPLSFDAGLSQLTTGIAAGARIVLHNYIRAQEVERVCAKNAITAITGVPPLWNQLSAVPWNDEARRSISVFANTGGQMPMIGASCIPINQWDPCRRDGAG